MDERTDGRTMVFQYTHHSASGGIMSNLYKGPSIDASYQVSAHLAEGFQRRRLKCEY